MKTRTVMMLVWFACGVLVGLQVGERRERAGQDLVMHYRGPGVNPILERYQERNAGASLNSRLASALGRPARWRIEQALEQIAESVSAEEIPAVLAELAKDWTSWRGHMSFAKRLVGRWSQSDSRSAFDFVVSLPTQDRFALLEVVLSEWGVMDALGAAERVKVMPISEERDWAMAKAIRALARQNPEQARLFAESLEELGRNPTLRSFMLGGWAESDPHGAAMFVAGSSGTSPSAVSDIAYRYALADPGSAMGWLDSFKKGPLRDHALEGTARAMADANPREAANFALSEPVGTARDRMLGVVAKNWASSDPTQAMHWARDIPEDASRKFFVSKLIEQWAETDPVAAATASRQMNDDVERDALSAIARSWAWRDALAALTWATDLPTDAQTAVQIPVVSALIRGNASLAGQSLLSVQDGELRAQWLGILVREWANSDISGATEFLTTLPVGPARERAVLDIGAAMIRSDPAHASELLASQPSGASRDKMLRAAVSTWAGSAPEDATRWAAQLEGEEQRRTLFIPTVMKWAEYSPEEAARFVSRRSPGTAPEEIAREVAYLLLVTSRRSAAEVWMRESGLPEDVQAELIERSAKLKLKP